MYIISKVFGTFAPTRNCGLNVGMPFLIIPELCYNIQYYNYVSIFFTLKQWFSTGYALRPEFYVGHHVKAEHYNKVVYHKEMEWINAY